MFRKSQRQRPNQQFSEEHLEFLRIEKKQHIKVWAARFLLLILLFVLWEVAANMRWITLSQASPVECDSSIYRRILDLSPYGDHHQ